MNEKQKQDAPEKKYIPEQEAIAASKRALARLRGDIVAIKLQTDLEINTRPAGHSSVIFLEAINNPSVANVMAAQEILARNLKAIEIDGVIGRNTLSAISNFMFQQQAETKESKQLPLVLDEGPAKTLGEQDKTTPIFNRVVNIPTTITPALTSIPLSESLKPQEKVIDSSLTLISSGIRINENSRFTDPFIYERARAMINSSSVEPSNTPVILPAKALRPSPQKLVEKVKSPRALSNKVVDETN